MRRSIRCRSTSTHSAQPPLIVTASGWAPPMPPSPAVTTSRPAQRAAEALARHRGERLVGALQDPLGADVDPGPRGHLAVHHQPGGVELAEVLPGRPLRAPGSSWRSARAARPRASRTPPTGLPDCTSSVSSSPRRCSSRLIVAQRRVVARGLADPAVDDQLLRAARPRRDAGCSRASAAPPPAASPGTSQHDLPGSQRLRQRRQLAADRAVLLDARHERAHLLDRAPRAPAWCAAGGGTRGPGRRTRARWR